MATQLLSYPFRLTPGGQVATVDEGSDESNSELLAVVVLTRAGERPLVPAFGIADPVFTGFEADALQLHVELFGPAVQLERVEVEFVSDTAQDVVVHFSS